MTSQQARALQRAINGFVDQTQAPMLKTEVDGDPGPDTKRAVRDARYYLGFLPAYVNERLPSGAELKRLIRRLEKPRGVQSPATWLRGWRRRRAARKDPVKVLAAKIGNHPNADWLAHGTTGSDRPRLIELTRHGKCRAGPQLAEWVRPRVNLLKAMYAMAKVGPVLFTSLTGHKHITNLHPSGRAVDASYSRGKTRQREIVAREFNVTLLREADHEHWTAQ